MLGNAFRALFSLLASSRTLKTLATHYGLRTPTSVGRRFIAGETIEEVIAVARGVQAQGLTLTLNHLGEHVTTMAQAEAATRTYLAIVDAVVAAGVERNLSLKLTQLGLNLDRASAIDRLRQILDRADPAGFFVRLDMENSPYIDPTLEVAQTMWQQGYRGIGVVLQSALFRSEKDLARINALGGRVRLVKGAYREPRSVAYQKKSDVDAAYLRMTRTLLREGTAPAFATHDLAMIDAVRRWADDDGIAPDRFEFQMLYGIRRDLQRALVCDGYRVRVYIPFGHEWFPYFMRRLGERPANVGFVLRGIAAENR
jgi:proline dehydrogenase